MSIRGIGRQQSISFWNLPKIVLAWMLGWWLVETIDHDGEVRLRRLYQDQKGKFVCRKIMGWCELLPDGTTKNGSYVHNWRPFARFDSPIAAMEENSVCDAVGRPADRTDRQRA